jgi:basic membrane protein A and related proteins
MRTVLLFTLCALAGCKKESTFNEKPAPVAKVTTIGLVTDVGGRGDNSFNDSALRGLESWAAGSKFVDGKYELQTPIEREAAIPDALKRTVKSLPVKPLVLQSKSQEDYLPNLQLLVDQGSQLTIGTGFLLENAVEAAAKANPGARFLLIDSPILDAQGNPVKLPNVRTVVFKEEEGSFLAGALAGLVSKSKVGFVGGMETPLIKKFEMGFRAGVKTTNPTAVVLVQYTGSFDNVSHGKQVASDFVNKGVEVVFHAAGSDGNGVIQAVKEGRASGRNVYAIGVDSDQSHLAPDAVLTSMVKRVDLAVWQSLSDVVANQFSSGDVVLGLKDNGVSLAPVTLDFPNKKEVLATIEALQNSVVSGALKVPSRQAEFDAFVAATAAKK